MLDEKLIVLLVALVAMGYTDKRPLSLQAITVEREFEHALP
jgi:hypothetical protein